MNSSSKVRSVLLLTFVVLTLLFGSLSTYEFVQINSLEKGVSDLKSSTSTATIPEEGLIDFYKIGEFYYKRVVEMNQGESITFKGVTFTNLKLNETYTGCFVYFFKLSFQDGTNEVEQVNLCGLSFEPRTFFTNHTNPRAGVIVSHGNSPIAEGTYLLVSG
jgi:hypothetical protein